MKTTKQDLLFIMWGYLGAVLAIFSCSSVKYWNIFCNIIFVMFFFLIIIIFSVIICDLKRNPKRYHNFKFLGVRL